MLNTLLPRTARYLLQSTAHNLRQSAKALTRQPRPVFQALHTPEELRQFSEAARVSTSAASSTTALALPVTAVEPDANGIRVYLERPPAFEFEPGQFLTITTTIDGAQHRRQYSIFTSPEDRAKLGLAIRRVADGLVSNHLADTLVAGDTLRADGPSGRFTLAAAAEDSDLVLIAGGVGITPLLSIAQAGAARDRRVRLIYANRGVRSTMLSERVAQLAGLASVELTHVLERKAKSRPSEIGRVDATLLARVLETGSNADYFVCGPGPMMDTVTAYLRDAGVAEDRIHTERFAQASAAVSASARTHAVRFARTGRLVNIPEGQSILEGARAAGIELPFSCAMGGCAACKVRCEGDVHLPDPNCLTPEEAAAGETLACIACPRSALTIDA